MSEFSDNLPHDSTAKLFGRKIITSPHDYKMLLP